MTDTTEMLPIFPEDLQELLKFAFAAALDKHPMNFTDQDKARWKEYSKRPVPLSTMQRMSYQVEVPRGEMDKLAFERGLRSSEGRTRKQLKQAQKRAAAANKNAARLFKDACDARERARIAEERLAKVPAHILAMFR